VKEGIDWTTSRYLRTSTRKTPFSPSDIAGFREFVPHIHWRLKGKPYGAVVVAPASIDAALWEENALRLPLALNVDGTAMFPTRFTNWDEQ